MMVETSNVYLGATIAVINTAAMEIMIMAAILFIGYFLANV